jgi:Predicted pPIWI-associating nuclease
MAEKKKKKSQVEDKNNIDENKSILEYSLDITPKDKQNSIEPTGKALESLSGSKSGSKIKRTGRAFESPFVALSQAKINEQKKMLDIVQPYQQLLENSQLNSTVNMLESIVSPMQSVIESYKTSQDNNIRAIEEIVGGLFLRSDDLERYYTSQKAMTESLLDQLIPTRNITRNIDQILSEINKMSEIMRQNFSILSDEAVGHLLKIPQDIQLSLNQNLLEMVSATSKFYEDFSDDRSEIEQFPPEIFHLPAEGLYTSTELIRVVSIDKKEDDGFVEERQKQSENIKDRNQISIEKLLMTLDPKLLKLLEGARKAIISDNEDRVRHYATSMRELITHILHKIAPDNKIKKWSQNDEHYHNKRPTRKARILYICRRVNHGSFASFLKFDIDAFIQIIDLFNKTVHGLEILFSDIQIDLLQMKSEALINALLVVEMFNSD